MRIYDAASLNKLISHAQAVSMYYKELYKGIKNAIKLEDLPISDVNQYSNHQLLANDNLQSIQSGGICLRTSGTSGQPKVSFWAKEEWETLSRGFANFYANNKIINPGDRIANLYVCGDLSGSLLLNHNIFRHLDCIEFPLANINVTHATNLLEKICPQIIIGSTGYLVKLASYLYSNNISLHSIKKVLYGNEGIHIGQYLFLKKVFPTADILSAGYASTDAGLLGFSDYNCNINEFITTDQTVIEIIDKENLLPIHEIEKEGIILATNFTKNVTPVIRYPVGDLGYWTDTSQTRFKLTTRNRPRHSEKIILSTGEEISPNIVYCLTTQHSYKELITGIQINIEKFSPKDDRLIVLIAIEEDIQNYDLELIKNATIKILKTLIKTLDYYLTHNKLEITICNFYDLEFEYKTIKFQGINVIKKY